MPRTDDRNIAEAIGRIARDLQDLQEGNDPDEDLAVARDTDETIAASESVTESEAKSGDDRFLHTLTQQFAEELQDSAPAHKIGFAETHE